MSLWTPDGERPIPRAQPTPPPAPDPGPAAGSGSVSMDDLAEMVDMGTIDLDQLTPEQRAELEAMAAEMAEARRQIASVPAAVVVANHAMGLYEVAAIHLNQPEPNFVEARVAIDGLAGLMDALQGRLGPDEPALREALQQLQLVFVQLTRQMGQGG